MRFNKRRNEWILFVVTHGLSWLNFVSTILIVFITLTRNFDRIDDIKIYIFSAVIWVFGIYQGQFLMNLKESGYLCFLH